MNYYEELGINKEATMTEIKRAYRHLAKKYHPDKNPGDEKAAKRFVRIAAAYEVLGDEESRKEYDNNLGTRGNTKGTKKQDQNVWTGFNPMDMNMSSEFENFFGFTTAGDKVESSDNQTKSKTNPIDTTQMFERFFKR